MQGDEEKRMKEKKKLERLQKCAAGGVVTCTARSGHA